VSSIAQILIWVVIVGAVFAYMWRKGHLNQLSNYVQQTREELRKCTWPTWDELKGSTVVVSISIFLLGGFTLVLDRVFFVVISWISRV